MNSTAPHTPSDSLGRSNLDDHRTHSRSTVSWGAILAGATAALALHVLFMMLGAGLGLSIYNPLTSDNPVSNVSVGALVIHSIVAIIALGLGGWVAGRFSPVRVRDTAWLHGFCVWGVAMVGGVYLVALGAGVMVGGLTKMVGSGLSAAGDPMADLASEAMNRSGDTITSYVDEAVGSVPEGSSETNNVRATREIGMAVSRLFNPAQEGNTAENRSAAVETLAEHTEMNEAEADRTISEWTTSFERLQDDLAATKEAAATQAREAADSTADALGTFSLWGFLGFLLGAAAAAGGGYLGAKCATECEETVDAPASARD